MNAPTAWLLAVAAVAMPSRDAVAAPSLCAAQETAYFSCATARQRIASLCGTAPQSLQYRFGRPGAIELAFPEDPSEGGAKMLYAHYSRYRTNRVELRFENAGFEYTLFDYREGARRHAGVRVLGAGGKERLVHCTGRVDSRLGELEGVLPCDAESALNLGACR
jgi:hypothetical protein